MWLILQSPSTAAILNRTDFLHHTFVVTKRPLWPIILTHEINGSILFTCYRPARATSDIYFDLLTSHHIQNILIQKSKSLLLQAWQLSQLQFRLEIVQFNCLSGAHIEFYCLSFWRFFCLSLSIFLEFKVFLSMSFFKKVQFLRLSCIHLLWVCYFSIKFNHQKDFIKNYRACLIFGLAV